MIEKLMVSVSKEKLRIGRKYDNFLFLVATIKKYMKSK